METIKVKSTKVKHTPNGVWSGEYEWQIMLVDGMNSTFKGCPMGRDRDANYAVRDFVRRVNIENNLSLSPRDIEIVEESDRSGSGYTSK
jgi:hypothetical protein